MLALARASRALIKYTGYPALIVAAVVAADATWRWSASAGLAITGAFVLSLLVTLLLERVVPFEHRWQPRGPEVKQDLSYLGLAALLQPASKLVGQSVAALLAIAVSRLVSSHVHSWSLPDWSKLALALAGADLAKYGLHRLGHERPWWWRFHGEHHAPKRIYALNGIRLHPVNLMWNLALDAAFPVLLGLTPRATVALAVFRGTVALLQHANIDFRIGGLNLVFSSTELHRWHHSTAMAQAGSNFGSTLILWDLLFGTYLHPREERGPAAVGLADGESVPAAMLHQLVWPWCSSRAAHCPWVRGWTARRS